MATTRTFAAAALAAAVAVTGCGGPANAPSADTVVATAAPADTAGAAETETVAAPVGFGPSTGAWERHDSTDEWNDLSVVAYELVGEAEWPARVSIFVGCYGTAPVFGAFTSGYLVAERLQVDYRAGDDQIRQTVFTVAETETGYRASPVNSRGAGALLRRIADNPGRLLIGFTDDYRDAATTWRWEDTTGLLEAMNDLEQVCGFDLHRG